MRFGADLSLLIAASGRVRHPFAKWPTPIDLERGLKNEVGWHTLPKSMSQMKVRLPRGPFAFLLCFSVLVPPFQDLFAQDRPPPVSSDRPTAAASSHTVPFDTLQLELGGQYSRGDATTGTSLSTTNAFSTPLLLRYGPLENFELRVATAGVSWQSITPIGPDGLHEESSTGFANPSLGFKWQLNDPEENSYEPSVGLLFDWSLPVGSEAFSPEKSEVEVTGLLDVPLPAGFGLIVNGSVALPYDSDTERCFTQGFGAILLTKGLAHQAGVFAEAYIEKPTGDGGDEQIFIDAGVTYHIGPGYQLDFAVFKGVGRVSSDWAVTGGLSFYILDGI